MTAYKTDAEWARALSDELDKLRHAAMQLDNYWTQQAYVGNRNEVVAVVIREEAFAELRDLLGLKEKVYGQEPDDTESPNHICNARCAADHTGVEP